MTESSIADRPPRTRWAWSLGVLLLLAGLTTLAWQLEKRRVEAERVLDFNRDTAQFTLELGDRLNLHAQFLRTFAIVFGNAPAPDAAGWQDLIARLQVNDHLPGVLAYGYAPRVYPEERAAFEAATRRKLGAEDFRITPAATADPAFPVRYLAPSQPVAGQALGFDMFSEPIRRAAILQACTSDAVAISAPTHLVFDRAGEVPGFIMYRAIYRPGLPTSSAEERRRALAGVAYSAYRTREFIQSLGLRVAPRLAFEIFDDQGYSSTLGREQLTLGYASRDDLAQQSVVRTTRSEISFGGRTWRVLFHELEEGSGTSVPDKPTLLLIAGLLLSASLAAILHFQINHRYRAEASAQRITHDLVATESALRVADTLKQAVLDAATEIAVIATDAQGTITLFNRGAERMLGYTASAMVGHGSVTRFHDAAEIHAREVALSERLGRPVTGFEVFATPAEAAGMDQSTWTYLRSDGQRLPVELTVTPQHDGQGRIFGYLGIAVDVSKRIAAEQELRAQHAILQSIIEHIPGGVSLVDGHLNFIAANRELGRLLELPPELLQKKDLSFYDVALFNAQRGEYGPGDPVEQARQRTELARNPVSHQVERERPNGRTLEIRGTPLPAGGFVTIYTDISARKAAEAELRRHRDHLQELVGERTARLERALAAAQAAHQAKSEFLANMSHELRTPMHAILSFSNLGMGRSQAPELERLHQYFSRIHESAERLLLLINDLLDLSQLESGQSPRNTEDFALPPILVDVRDHLESLLLERGLTLHIDVADPLPAVTGARQQIERVIHNLLSNAIKFSPPGGTIALQLVATTLPGGRRSGDSRRIPAILLAVVDQGPGIPDGELESIFDKFVQSTRTKTGAGGTGLGLAICREIVLAHRGTISAENNTGGGSTFKVCLPTKDPSAGEFS